MDHAANSPGSSLSLSPAPSPHSQPIFDNIVVRPHHSEYGSASSTQTGKGQLNADAKPSKVTKPRKKKSDVPGEDEKEKKPRKPRTINPEAAARRKLKAEQKAQAQQPATSQPSSSMSLSDMMQPRPLQYPSLPVSSPSQPVMKNQTLAAPAPASTPRPVSSGQRYDPIRGIVTGDPVSTVSPAPKPNASSSLASLMNPSPPAKSALSALMQPASAPVNNGPPARSHPTLFEPSVKSQPAATKLLGNDIAMENSKAPSLLEKVNKPVSNNTSTAPTPKERRSSPPRPAGSGLLSSSDLFGGGSIVSGGDSKGIDIVLDLPLKAPAGTTNMINIAQEIMRKYGRDAINPRAAAHRDRLLQVAAAANSLEQGLGDEAMLDGSDRDEDSNVEMGGMDEEKSADDGKRKRKRTNKEDYDREDDFIDDTEMAWEESAKAAQDGFFVYSGPLIAEDNKTPANATTTSGRGRGRGRGRGSRGGATGSTHASSAAARAAAAASGAASPATGSNASGLSSSGARGGGRGRGRGAPGVPRKPRMTKMTRERLEFEAQQAELKAARETLGSDAPMSP